MPSTPGEKKEPSMIIRLKRAYDAPAPDDGYRVLVDRIWPRGVSKEKARLDEWLKELAPSSGLRKWFNHEPDKWEEFIDRYFKELDGHPELLAALARQANQGCVTLIFSARDLDHNNAAALKRYLERLK
jgi:uncharacterized protein YeaO (DUF488 family)